MNSRTFARMCVAGAALATIGLALAAAIMGHKLTDAFVPHALIAICGGAVLIAMGVAAGVVTTIMTIARGVWRALGELRTPIA